MSTDLQTKKSPRQQRGNEPRRSAGDDVIAAARGVVDSLAALPIVVVGAGLEPGPRRLRAAARKFGPEIAGDIPRVTAARRACEAMAALLKRAEAGALAAVARAT